MIWEREWKKFFTLVFISTLVCYFSFMPSYTISCLNHSINQMTKSNHWVTVNNFADFNQRLDVNSLESYNNDQTISFKQIIFQNGGSDEYIYLFDYNCQDFYLNITMNYNFNLELTNGNFYTDASTGASSSVVLASRYNEDGDFYNNGELGLCYAYIVNYGSPFYHLGAYPNETRDFIESNSDDVNLFGVTKYHFERVNEELSCRILNNGKEVLSKTWSSGVSKPVNMILIYTSSHSYHSMFSVDYTNINGELEFTTKLIGIQPNTSPTIELSIPIITTYFAIVGCFSFIKFSRKAKNK